MAAYLIVYREGPVQDAAQMAEYQRKTREMKSDIKPTPLVVYGAIHPLERDPPDGVIVVQFASTDEAKAWYNSPGYQAALPHRKKAANFRAIIVEGR